VSQRYLHVTRTLEVTLDFRNWTFGIWWGRFTYAQRAWHFGLDAGPLEVVWIRR